MFKKIKGGLEKIRRSNDNIKKRWVIGMSALAILAITTLWLVYIDYLIKPVRDLDMGETINFRVTFKNGLRAVIDKFLAEKTIIIQK